MGFLDELLTTLPAKTLTSSFHRGNGPSRAPSPPEKNRGPAMSKEVPMKKKPLYKHLYVQVLFAIACGVLLGHFWPDTGAAMKPLGDGFIKLIKMIIAPIIFCTVVTGIAGMEDMKKVGRVGGKALLYFEAVSTVALIIGLVVVNTLKPGAGMNVDIAALDTKAL